MKRARQTVSRALDGTLPCSYLLYRLAALNLNIKVKHVVLYCGRIFLAISPTAYHNDFFMVHLKLSQAVSGARCDCASGGPGEYEQCMLGAERPGEMCFTHSHAHTHVGIPVCLQHKENMAVCLWGRQSGVEGCSVFWSPGAFPSIFWQGNTQLQLPSISLFISPSFFLSWVFTLTEGEQALKTVWCVFVVYRVKVLWNLDPSNLAVWQMLYISLTFTHTHTHSLMTCHWSHLSPVRQGSKCVYVCVYVCVGGCVCTRSILSLSCLVRPFLPGWWGGQIRTGRMKVTTYPTYQRDSSCGFKCFK